MYFELLYVFTNKERVESFKKRSWTSCFDGDSQTPQGRRYFELRREFPGAVLSTKNHQGGINDNTDEADGKMFEVRGSPRCPVETMQNFLSHLNPALDCLFQRPRDISPSFKPEDERVWYCNSPVGETTLSNMMKQMSIAAGIVPRLTNHCVRATSVTVCQLFSRFENEKDFEIKLSLSLTSFFLLRSPSFWDCAMYGEITV